MTLILMLAVTVKAIVDYLARPVGKILETPKDKRDAAFYFSIVKLYLSFVAGLAVAYLMGVNLYAEYFPEAPETLNRILTSCLVGGGASLIYDFFAALKQAVEKLGQVLPINKLPVVVTNNAK